MTEIKTAQAWGDTYETDVEGIILLELDDDIEMEIPYSDARVPVVIVHGMTEAEVHEAAALRSACRELGVETVEQFNVIVRMACELRNMTAIHDYEEQVYQKIVPEIRAEYE